MMFTHDDRSFPFSKFGSFGLLLVILLLSGKEFCSHTISTYNNFYLFIYILFFLYLFPPKLKMGEQIREINILWL